MDEEFVEVLKRVSAGRTLNVAHGKLVRKILVKEFKPPPIPPREPLEQLFDFKYEHGYRTLDLLIRMDKDRNMVIDREEFKNGLLVSTVKSHIMETTTLGNLVNPDCLIRTPQQTG